MNVFLALSFLQVSEMVNFFLVLICNHLNFLCLFILVWFSITGYIFFYFLWWRGSDGGMLYHWVVSTELFIVSWNSDSLSRPDSPQTGHGPASSSQSTGISGLHQHIHLREKFLHSQMNFTSSTVFIRKVILTVRRIFAFS